MMNLLQLFIVLLIVLLFGHDMIYIWINREEYYKQNNSLQTKLRLFVMASAVVAGIAGLILSIIMN